MILTLKRTIESIMASAKARGIHPKEIGDLDGCGDDLYRYAYGYGGPNSKAFHKAYVRAMDALDEAIEELNHVEHED